MKITTAILTSLIIGAGSLSAAPTFKLAVSEYPSWSLFLTASDLGLINMDEGKMGPIEKKWEVDIVLVETDYDTCITLYGSGQVDAACLTNMDSLAPSLQIESVAILPTSTSDGADQCIVTKKYTTLDEIKEVPVYGLENSVSQYLFDRYIEDQGMDPAAFNFSMMDPAAASTAFLQGKVDAIVVWNPFCLEIQSQDKDSLMLFSSKSIPNEIIDMVTMSRKSLDKEGGEAFACAVIDTYYRFCGLMTQSKTRDQALIALGERFSKLGLADMRTIVKETRFYDTPEKGQALFESEALPKTMDKVSKFCVKQGIVAENPSLAFGKSNPGTNLSFDPSYIKQVAKK
ncbi:MAG: hypothetical protein AAFX93_13080 [Verrucomicrobiota bacterium]